MYDLPCPGNDVGMKVPATAQDSAKGNMETEEEKTLCSTVNRSEQMGRSKVG